MNRVIIAIGRQFGSGGREIGKALASSLDIPYYDKDLIALAAKKSGMSPEIFEQFDEKPTKSLLYSLAIGSYMFGSRVSTVSDMPMNDKLYTLQVNIIQDLAKQGSCILIGRCADYILRDDPDLISLFIHAPLAYRKRRIESLYSVPQDKIEGMLAKADKSRANYYNYYTERKWGSASNYDLSIDSSLLSLEDTVKFLREYVELKKG